MKLLLAGTRIAQTDGAVRVCCKTAFGFPDPVPGTPKGRRTEHALRKNHRISSTQERMDRTLKKTIVLIAMALAAVLLLAGVAVPADPRNPNEITVPVIHDEKNGTIALDLTREELEEIGICLGDSCDLLFSNGVSYEAVPFHSGYFVKDGAPIIVDYPGIGHIEIALNNIRIWEQTGLQEGDTVTIRLNQKEQYSAIENRLGTDYSVRREDYQSDEQFCNFRPLTGGKLKEGFLFRGASPLDNTRNRAAVTDTLLEKNGIRFILDLADTEETALEFARAEDFCSPYCLSLWQNGKIAFQGMDFGYRYDDFRLKLVDGLRKMMKEQGPVYIHCREGKDRTGFCCILLEALAGASYGEVLDDYVETYRNYYELPMEHQELLAGIFFDDILSFLIGAGDAEPQYGENLSAAAEAYLQDGGMTDREIAELKAFICRAEQ